MNIASLIKTATVILAIHEALHFYTRKMCLQLTLRRFGGNVLRACARHQRGGDGLGRVGMCGGEGLRTRCKWALRINSDIPILR
jgi:hypothetical protein